MAYCRYCFLVLIIISNSCSNSSTVELIFNAEDVVQQYAAERLKAFLRDNNNTAHVVIIASAEDQSLQHIKEIPSEFFDNITPEGYRILPGHDTVLVLGKDAEGCLYGMMDLIEQIGSEGDFKKVEERFVNPALGFRAIKFNLPWAPYRPGPATDLHMETCRDLEFWEAFLDMMVTNRFNALTLWSTHLFPYMIRAENYPLATPFNNVELEEWQVFWKKLFAMARERGIETYLLNWNIVVSPEFAENYGAEVHDDRSELVKKYTQESVTQLINEYEDLTGLGVTLADWMGNWGEDLMTSGQREAWISETFVKGMREADRKVKFIHRAVLAGDPMLMREVIDKAALPDPTIVEVKFNWSHGHSTPRLSLTHSNDQGTIMRGFWDPAPENFFIAWMIRNEDFFVLRWGNPDFIRDHIRINHHSYVDGYFVGSEGYIPALDYSHKEHLQKTRDYAFEKQWMYYHLWGRLLFNPLEENLSLSRALHSKYPEVNGMELLKAYSLASKVPLHLASFYKSTWDFTLYSEGFLAPWTTGYDDDKSPFISLEELIRHETLDATYLGISEYCQMIHEKAPVSEDLITPLELSKQVKRECSDAIRIIEEIRATSKQAELRSELDDLETWCHLGYYFSEKIMAGVSLQTYRLSNNSIDMEEAVRHLRNCIMHWENVIRLTRDRYQPMPYVSMGHHEQKWPGFKEFHWENFMEDVKADLEYVQTLKKIQ